MKLLVSKGVDNPHGKPLDVSWTDFRNLVYQYNIALADESDDTKRNGIWFSCAEYKDNYRLRKNIVGKVWAIVADFDRVTDPVAVDLALKRWEYLAWTTWNSTPENPRWRVVLPVEGGVTIDGFEQLVRRVLGAVGKAAQLDSRSYLPEQLWFFPWHKRSQGKNHQIWQHSGSWIKGGHLIEVDFTGVKLAHKPEEIDEGDRNNSLVVRLGMPDALLCPSREELEKLALDWNDRLPVPMVRKEVRDVVRKKWNWLTHDADGIRVRGEAWRHNVKPGDLPEIGTQLMSDAIRSAMVPKSLVGDFLFPGGTLMTAKMKEGKSFLAMQLALSVATGNPFLQSARFEGFDVKEKKRVVIVAGEDTESDISMRFMGSIAQGYLPEPASSDVLLVFNDQLDEIRRNKVNLDGAVLFEVMVDRWYEQGYRLICIDPMRVLEAALGIVNYPGVEAGTSAHAKDFLTMRYYTRIAQKYPDLYIVVSMHHGKNKRDKDKSDPGDMIAGTTGFGAAAVSTISLLPIPDQLEAQEDPATGERPKRRELYMHGRHTREKRILIEQNIKTGIWKGIGYVGNETQSHARKTYFQALIELGASERFVPADEIARKTKAHPKTVTQVLARARRDGNEYLGWRLIVKRGMNGGYKLIASYARRTGEQYN